MGACLGPAGRSAWVAVCRNVFAHTPPSPQPPAKKGTLVYVGNLPDGYDREDVQPALPSQPPPPPGAAQRQSTLP